MWALSRTLRQVCSATTIAEVPGRRRDSTKGGGLGGVLHEASASSQGSQDMVVWTGDMRPPSVELNLGLWRCGGCRVGWCGRFRGGGLRLDCAALCLVLDPGQAEELV